MPHTPELDLVPPQGAQPPLDAPEHARGADIIHAFAETLPDSPGVYRMLDAQGQVLYIGKAKRLKRRVLAYTRPQDTARLTRMVSQTRSMLALTTCTENEALLLEQQLVREIQPPFNIKLKDSKSFPGILITTSHPYPRMSAHRGKPPKGERFFGPFASARNVEHATRQLQRLFLLRTCDEPTFAGRTRPCLLHQIHRCSAPCVGKVSQAEYAQQIEQATAFLEGKRQDISKTLEHDMMAAAERQDYERAAGLRDRLKALAQVKEEQHVSLPGILNADIVALAQEGRHVCVQILFMRGGQMRGSTEQYPKIDEDDASTIMGAFLEQFYTHTQPPENILVSHLPPDSTWTQDALHELWGSPVRIHHPQRGAKHNILRTAQRNAQEALARQQAGQAAWDTNMTNLGKALNIETVNRVEIYDNSHIQGAYALGVAVVASREGFLKSHYRKYNFAPESGIAGNDTAMMHEMLVRRFGRMRADPDAEWPDLLLIDGGITQLRAALHALASIDVQLPCVGVAKGKDRDAGKEVLHFPDGRVFALPMKDPTLYFIQRLRDEAHRFAISSHRNARAKGARTGPLDSIPGLGPVKRRALTARFGSQKAAIAASLDELRAVPGITAALAQAIKDA